MKLSTLLYSSLLFLSGALATPQLAHAQLGPSMYGDAAKADVKVHYVYTLEDALARARREKKPIFFNCFADWALPCHGMNQHVFSDAKFAAWLEQHFVPLIMDVSRRENQDITDRFKIRFFAHYLVLDAEANVLHRIVGGKPLPLFQNELALALSPKTSLAGLTKAYADGRRDKKTLAAYLHALFLSNDTETYNRVAEEYLALIKPKDYARPENYDVISRIVTTPQSPYYQHLVEHKADYVRHNGASTINDFIQSIFYGPITGMATGAIAYDRAALRDIYISLQRAELPDTARIFRVYEVARLRGERQYDQLIDYLRSNATRLSNDKVSLLLGLDLPEMSAEVRTRVIALLREQAQLEQAGSAKHLNNLADNLERPDGISFTHSTFSEALAKAKAEGKLVFMDCYTSWCGPCKMMARDVFTRPEVGRAFNERFVSIKIDMEKGEGVELAKRFNVSAFPTLLFLNADGQVLHTLVGARQPQQLIDEAASVK